MRADPEMSEPRPVGEAHLAASALVTPFARTLVDEQVVAGQRPLSDSEGLSLRTDDRKIRGGTQLGDGSAGSLAC